MTIISTKMYSPQARAVTCDAKQSSLSLPSHLAVRYCDRCVQVGIRIYKLNVSFGDQFSIGESNGELIES